MNEEIKEILDNLKSRENYKYRSENGRSYKELEGWEIDKLLDYITNLQEENRKLKELLQQEKKDFKEANDYCFELKKYKSRNEKAMKYINNLEKDYDINVWQEDKHWAYILYVLGGDKE